MKKFTEKGELTRQRILKTAIGLFAKKGFAGTSVDEIVDTTGINKRMVYHYFGSKELLYQEALATEYAKLEALELETLHPDEPVEKVVSSIVSTYFSFLLDNPDFVMLLLQENMNRGLNLDKMEMPLSKSPMLELLIQVVKTGQKNGTVRKNIDPRFLLISLIGNCMIYCSNRFTLSRALAIDLGDKQVLKKACDAVSEILLHGIKA
ncbi:MAG: TetR family transcriptional regulator [Verrucomicrobia bacterium]|nr:TetR family transcriptional regulator [Verrucomicrobiota bacterium]